MTEHLSPEDGTGALTPDDGLRDIELGDRVDWWLTNWELSQLYSQQDDRNRFAALTMIGQVAERTSRGGLPFPAEWWPPGIPLTEHASG